MVEGISIFVTVTNLEYELMGKYQLFCRPIALALIAPPLHGSAFIYLREHTHSTYMQDANYNSPSKFKTEIAPMRGFGLLDIQKG
jgi:hypothetical protein